MRWQEQPCLYCSTNPSYPLAATSARLARMTGALSGLPGFDHGVGHSLLLLYDAKVSNGQKSKEFKGLGHYPSNTSLSSF